MCDVKMDQFILDLISLERLIKDVIAEDTFTNNKASVTVLDFNAPPGLLFEGLHSDVNL